MNSSRKGEPCTGDSMAPFSRAWVRAPAEATNDPGLALFCGAGILAAPLLQEIAMAAADPFARLIPEARAFLSELATHNEREWFAEHKSRYETELKAPTLLLLDQVAHDIGRKTGSPPKPKLFRPHRDVRFSKDKTPYTTHLHMMWSLPGAGGQNPAIFFGIAPDYVTVGGGIMGFDKPVLTQWRAAIDGGFGDAVQATLDGLAKQGLKPREPELKRVPAPFDKAHRHGTLLRRKGLAVWRELPERAYATPLAELNQTFDQLAPLFDQVTRAL